MLELTKIRESGVFTELLGFEPIVENLDDYEYFKNNGYEPLLDWRFDIYFPIRLELQMLLFGKNIHREDDYFFRWIWDRSEHYCREFMAPLYEYSAIHMSHIITKGSHTEMRHDVRNINIFSELAHRIWDTGTLHQKMKMNIWPENKRMIEILNKDYQL